MKSPAKILALTLTCMALHGVGHAAPPSSTCSTWDVSGAPLVAHDRGYQIIFRIDQSRPRFGGTAQYTQGVEGYTQDVQTFSRAPGSNITGSDKARITGVVKDNRIKIETEYGVVYVGTIDANGLVRGQYHFKAAPSGRATWGSSRPRTCLDGTGAKSTTTSSDVPLRPAQTAPTTHLQAERNSGDRGGGAGASALRGAIAIGRHP